MRLAGTVLAFLGMAAGGASAIAADLGTPPAPLAVPAAHDWTGPYAGVLLGSTRQEQEAFVGGGQVGYNWQLGSRVLGLSPVLGVEAGAYQTNRTTLNSLGLARGRAGLALDGTLFYASFGVAGITTRSRVFYEPLGAGVDTITNSSQTLLGFTAGAGVQTMISRSLSLRLDYAYVDGGSYNAFGTFSGPRRVNIDAHIVSAGVDFHFNEWRMDYATRTLRGYVGGGGSAVHNTGRGVEKYEAGAKGYGGVELGDWAALEVGYLYLGSVAGRDVRAGRDLEASAVTASALVFSDPLLTWLLPADAPRARLFGRAGGAYVMGSETFLGVTGHDDGVALNVGAGLQVDFDQVFVRAEYEYVSMVESKRILGIRHTPLSVSAGIRF